MDEMAPVFRALGDPGRRLLLDRLFERDGRTLGELCEVLPGMTRFGVMRHLGVLEAADLVTTRKEGRRKLHYLNPVPIRLVHDRWISKYAEPVVGSMAALKEHLEETAMERPDHVYSVYVKAPTDQVWRAILDGDQTVHYYYGTRVASDWTPGAPVVYTYPDGRVAADGTVLSIEPGSSVTLTFHARWDPEIDAEGPVTMTWAVAAEGDLTRLTVTTAGLRSGSRMDEEFRGGIVFIVSGLKTYVETGDVLAAG